MIPLLLISGLIKICTAKDSPIIGLLSQETYLVDELFPGNNYASFIAASYVKFVESAGGRALPVWIGQDEEYYGRVVNYTNGLLFPGGGTYFNETKGYGEAAKIIYKLALEKNQNGNHYPLWGTCLGLQVLGYAAVGVDIRITGCALRRVSIPLVFEKGFKNSNMFSDASQEIIDILGTKNVTYNNHGKCLTKDVLKQWNITSDWRILTTNADKKNNEFISTMEHTYYPFYAVQFHPEKNAYEFKENYGLVHTEEAVKVTQFFANFFVNDCRKNNHSFPDVALEKKSLVYNYGPIYTGIMNGSYEQLYMFSEENQNNLLTEIKKTDNSSGKNDKVSSGFILFSSVFVTFSLCNFLSI